MYDDHAYQTRMTLKAKELALTQSMLISPVGRGLSKLKLTVDADFVVGDTFRITFEVSLGELTQEESGIQFYHDKVRFSDYMEGSSVEIMWLQETIAEGIHIYACTIYLFGFRLFRVYGAGGSQR